VTARRAVRIANFSGFYGDRFSALEEMVNGGPVDVLTGDYLAELTMFILWRTRERSGGYASGFLRQLEPILGACIDRGIKIVSNAGGLNPAGMATAVNELARQLHVPARVFHIEGDDLLPRLGELRRGGESFRHLDTGSDIEEIEPITANAYLGGWGICEALNRGADIVVCPRVTDASLVVGPAAWWHGWARNDWDRLAGAVAAGHVIECGTQATGGNYAFFAEIANLIDPGFPIAEIESDGSSVITKHPGAAGEVTTETVTAQLLYEIGEPAYRNPDVIARFDTTRVTQLARNRVGVSATRGQPPPAQAKVCINYFGGYRNSVTFVLTGLDIEAKAELLRRGLCTRVERDGDVQDLVFEMRAAGGMDTHLTVTVTDTNRLKVGRRFFDHVMSLGLASYPGLHLAARPNDGSAYGLYWPTLVDAAAIEEVVVDDSGERTVVQRWTATDTEAVTVAVEATEFPPCPNGPTRQVFLGRLVGARSGDKGGNANIGVWARDPLTYSWLYSYMTPAVLRALLPELAQLDIDLYPLPNLLGINVVVYGLLGQGVSSSLRSDPQAKSLGEALRACLVEVPVELLSTPSHRAEMTKEEQ
jgi:hypothetical protein